MDDREIEQAVLLAVREMVEVVVDVTRQPPFVATLTRHPALLEHRSPSPIGPRRPQCRLGSAARGETLHDEPATEETRFRDD